MSVTTNRWSSIGRVIYEGKRGGGCAGNYFSVWWMEVPSAAVVPAAGADAPTVEIPIEMPDISMDVGMVAPPAEPAVAAGGAVPEADADAAAGGGVAPEDDNNDPYCALCFGLDGMRAFLTSCMCWLLAALNVRALFLALLFACLPVVWLSHSLHLVLHFLCR